jgi:predicted regulator of Ras-like GTPase activity (Roadblock/LC7/MglB family)
MLVTLPTLLQRLTALDGVKAVVIAGRDGLVVAQSDLPLPDAEALAAFGAAALSAAEALGAEMRRAALTGLIIEYGDALISVDPLGDLAATVTRLEAAATLVPLRVTLRQVRGEMLAALDAM